MRLKFIIFIFSKGKTTQERHQEFDKTFEAITSNKLEPVVTFQNYDYINEIKPTENESEEKEDSTSKTTESQNVSFKEACF